MGIKRFRGEAVTLATSLTTAQVVGIPYWANEIEVFAPSSTIEVITVGLGPTIQRAYFYDASGPTYRAVQEAITDRNTATSLDVSVMQTADRVYIGLTEKARGLSVDVDGTNGAGTATMTVEVWNGRGWTDTSATDGTNSTATLDQDGIINWTVPAVWRAATISEVGDQSPDMPKGGEKLFWLRLTVSAALTDTSVTVDEIAALMSDRINQADGSETELDEIAFLSNNGTMAPLVIPVSYTHLTLPTKRIV